MASLIETPRSYQRRSEFYHQLSMLQQAGVGIRDSLHQINPHSRQRRKKYGGPSIKWAPGPRSRNRSVGEPVGCLILID